MSHRICFDHVDNNYQVSFPAQTCDIQSENVKIFKQTEHSVEYLRVRSIFQMFNS